VQTERSTTVTREVRIDASPESIFPFFTDPEKMTVWKGTSADLDPTVGGSYRVQVNPAALAVGEYVVIDPPRRVVFTWGWEGDPNVPPGSSTVEITLTPDGDGTIVSLTHSGLPNAESGVAHADGWDHFLPRLVIAAAGGDPGPIRWPREGTTKREGCEMGNPVVHFEVYGRNAKALQSFYSEAFGWEIHADNPMNYGLVHTNADGKGIDGGVAEGDPRANFMVEVPDLEASIATIESLGGKVVTPITVIPNMFT
jgi:uncharacterized protein YndB with AHSA1/START domain/predicted enzyme related to lactoylglutathione lyase